jgi:hypothetical protein
MLHMVVHVAEASRGRHIPERLFGYIYYDLVGYAFYSAILSPNNTIDVGMWRLEPKGRTLTWTANHVARYPRESVEDVSGTPFLWVT